MRQREGARVALLGLLRSTVQKQRFLTAGGEREAAGRQRASSQSVSHDGFDSDPATMNSVLYRILGSAPVRPLSRHDLAYD